MKRKEIKDLLLLKLSLISLCMLIFAAIFAEEISLDFIFGNWGQKRFFTIKVK